MGILNLREHGHLAGQAAQWFHAKWGIPVEAYEESINECLKCRKSVPQWYVAVMKDEIIGGIGVIENDFHDRKELSPNVCALYKDKDQDEHKYLCYCIPAGLLVGTVIAVLTPLNIGLGAGVGMLLGVTIGTTIDYEAKKKKSDK